MKSISYKLLAASGLPKRINRLFNANNISILMYHGIVDKPPKLPDWGFVGSASFKNQLKYLKQHFNIISLTEATKRLLENNINEPTAVITFDDGYQNNYDCAFPILEKEGIPATIFLTTQFIDNNRTIWTGHLHEAFSNTQLPKFSWYGHTLDLSNTNSRIKSLQFIKKELKSHDHSTLQEETYKIVSELVGVEGYYICESSPYRILNKESIRLMNDSGLIEFGAHTHNHLILNNLSKDKQEFEIEKSVNNVSSMTGKPCTLFAYPNGRKEDYSKTTISILRKHGIKSALTTINGTSDYNTPEMELRRLGIGSDMNLVTFKLTVHNTLNSIKKFFN